MYIYKRSEPRLWTVGSYAPEGAWQPESDHSSPDDAAKRVAYLNGGSALLVLETDNKLLRQMVETLRIEIASQNMTIKTLSEHIANSITDAEEWLNSYIGTGEDE